MIQTDKAGTEYWNNNWSRIEFPGIFDHTDTRLDNFVNLKLHEYFQTLIGDRNKIDVLEIGCANSIWPVYFHKYFNANVHGLDYSDIGCKRSRDIFKHYNVPGTVYHADLFSPPTDILKKFDLVVSFGVVEHFANTAHCLKSCAAFLKPNGYLFTLVPNMQGITGFLQKIIDRDVYDIHVPLSMEDIITSHNTADLELIACKYFLSINLGVVSSGKYSNHPFNKYIRRLLSAPSKMVWLLENKGLSLPVSSFLSPYIISLAKV